MQKIFHLGQVSVYPFEPWGTACKEHISDPSACCKDTLDYRPPANEKALAGRAFINNMVVVYFFLVFCLRLLNWFPFLKPFPSWLPKRSMAHLKPMVDVAWSSSRCLRVPGLSQ